MTPPEATQAGDKRPAGAPSPAVCVCPLETLKARAEFLRLNGGLRQGMPGFLLQARRREGQDVDPALVRIGITCSRKVGNAVERNRAKRRLREVARRVLPLSGQPGWDYVLIGRPEVTANRDFAAMQRDLGLALEKIHRKGPSE